MVFSKRIGDILFLKDFKAVKLLLGKRLKTVSEISQKQLVILRTQKRQNVIVVFIEMSEQVQKCRVRALAVEDMSVTLFLFFGIEYMAKKLLAEFLEQKILGLEMRIEGGSAYVRFFDYLTDRNRVKVLL